MDPDLHVSADDLRIGRAHQQAVAAGSRHYVDPVTGLVVVTELHHRRRGTCCGSACRHCPFDWKNVDSERFEGVDEARVARRRRRELVAASLAGEG